MTTKHKHKIDKVILEKVEQLFHKYPTIDHPLITRIAALQFTPDEFREIAIRFYHVIKHFPQFLAAMITNWDDTIARMPLVANLYEEHGNMRLDSIHVETFKHFLHQVGIGEEILKESKPSPGVLAYIRAIKNLCIQQQPLEGLAALGIIEDIVHRVSPIISHVGKSVRQDIEHVSHFDEHEVLDDQHSKEIYELLKCRTETDKELVIQGLTLGAYYHNRLYSDILEEVVGKDAAHVVVSKRPYYATHIEKTYPLQTGLAGDKRLKTLNRLYNPNSIGFIEQYLKEKSLQLLEVGCGGGELAHMLAKCNAEQLQVTAVDNSKAQITLAQSKYALANLTYRVDDVESLQKRGEKFDIIYLRWVLIYQPQPEVFLQNLIQCLNDGGVLIVEDNNPLSPGCFALEQEATLEFWSNFWRQAIYALTSVEDLEQSMLNSLDKLGAVIVKKALSQQVLQSKEDKEVFFLGMHESKERILAAGYPKEQFESLLADLWRLRETKHPINFVTNFQYAFKVSL